MTHAFPTRRSSDLGKGRRERIVLLTSAAQDALRRYMNEARPSLARHRVVDAVFLNARGGPLSDRGVRVIVDRHIRKVAFDRRVSPHRSEEHTSELQSLMRISYAVFCLKKKN